MPTIYLFSFPDDSVYVGQTINTPEDRFRQHCNDMIAGTHHSYKVQDAYNNQGLPKLLILEEVTMAQVDEREIYWISEFDSFYNGLNCTAGGQDIPQNGESNPSARYTLDDYKAIVIFLANTDMTPIQVSRELEVSRATVQHIANGNRHLYLKDLLPDEYAKMLAKKGRSKKDCVPSPSYKYPDVRDELGNVYQVTNLSKFALEHDINRQCLGQLMSGKLKCTGGFVLASVKPYKVCSPTGEIFSFERGSAASFSKQHGLEPTSLSNLINGKAKTHRGWTLYDEG
jgi:hypothetical protein